MPIWGPKDIKFWLLNFISAFLKFDFLTYIILTYIKIDISSINNIKELF